MPPSGSRLTRTISVQLNLEKADQYASQLNGAARSAIELQQNVESIGKATSNTVVEMQALVETQTHQVAQLREMHKSHLAISNVNKVSASAADKISKLNQQEVDLLKTQTSKVWTEINKSLEQKNAKHQQELKHVQDENKNLVDMMKLWDGIKKNIRDINTATTNYMLTMFNVYEAIRAANKASDNFNTANYRVFGSQIQITAEAYRTAAAFGLMGDEVIQAYKALGAQRLTNNINDFKKLSFEALAFSRSTGMTIESTVGLQKSLMATTGSIDQTSQYMAKIITHMKDFGLSTSEVNGLVTQHASKILELRSVYGSLTASITEAQIRLAAIAKDLGAPEQLVQRVGTALQNLEPMQADLVAGWAGYTGALITAEDRMNLFAAITRTYFDEVLNATQEGTKDRQIAVALFTGRFGELGKTAAQVGDQIKAQKMTMADFDAMLRKSADSAKKAANAEMTFWEELKNASDTIPRQLALLSEQVQNIFRTIWTAIAPGVLIIVKAIGMVVWVINAVVSALVTLLDYLGPVGTAIKAVLGVVLTLGVAALALGKVFALVAVGLTKLVVGIGALLSRIPLLASGITSIGVAFVNALRALLPVVPALLGLGVLFAGIGIAAWGLSSAIEKLSAVGMSSIIYLGLMTAALIGLGVAFAYIGKIATAGAPGLLAMGIAFAGIGAAAFGISALITTIAGNWQSAIATGFLLATVIGVVTTAIIALATVGTVAAPPLFLLGAALAVVGGAAYLIGLGISQMITALSGLSVKSTAVLVVVAVSLGVAGSLLVAAGVPLRRAAFDIMVAGAMLLVAGTTLAMAAIPFAVGSAGMGASAVVLLAGSIALAAAAAILKPATTILNSVLPELYKASLKLTVASAQFKASMDLKFLASAAILLGSSAAILASSLLLAVGGPLLIVGAMALLSAVQLLVIAAPLLEKSLNIIQKPALRLTITAASIMTGAGILLGAGAILLASSVTVGLAAAVLLISGVALMAASVLIGLAAGILNVSGGLMLAAGALLTAGSAALVASAIPIGVAAIAIGIAGLAIWLASKQLQWGAENLNEASQNFANAGNGLLIAGPLLSAGIKAIDEGTDGITRIGLSLWLGSKSFGKGATELYAAVMPIASAAQMLASGLNSIDVALARPYGDLFNSFSASLGQASEPMLAMLDDVSVRMASYASEIESTATRISGSFNKVNANDDLNASSTRPLARDRAAILSPESVSSAAESDKKMRLLEKQCELLSGIAVTLVELTKNGIAANPGDGNAALIDVMEEVRDALLSRNIHSDTQAAHMTDWS